MKGKVIIKVYLCRASVKPRPQPTALSRTLFCSRTAYVAMVFRFSGVHPRNLCNYMDCYLFTDFCGMEGLVGRCIEDSLSTEWSPDSDGFGAGQGKADILTD